MKVIIIEDESLLAKELKRTLLSIKPDIDVIQVIKSIKEGVKWFDKKIDADLIFSDIQLIDGTSFELFKKVNITTPIIFTTAYDEFAIKAFQLNSIDYLMKPIAENDLIRSLNKFENFWELKNELSTEVLNSLISKKSEIVYKSNFLIRVGDQYKQVNINEVSYFFAEGNTIFLVQSNGKKLIIDYSLDQVMAELDPKCFFRVNRQLIVSNSSIKEVHKYFNSRLKLNIQPVFNTNVLVTRSRVSDFLLWMNS